MEPTSPGELYAGQPISGELLARLFRDREPLFRQKLTGKIPAHLQSSMSIDDVLQEAWVDLSNKTTICRFRGERALAGWLDEVVENTLRDMIKHAHRLKRDARRQRHVHATSFISRFLGFTARGRTPSSELAARERAVEVHDAVEQLPEREKLALRMRTHSEHTRRSQAHSLDQSEAAYKALIARGRQKLRQILFRLQDEERR